MSIRIGVITSSGGHSLTGFVEALSELDVVFDVITDRQCGAEEKALELGVECTRFEVPARDSFSKRACMHLAERGAEMALLLLNRIVSEHLYRRLPCLNIHPALLPAFKGMSAIEDARAANVRFLGATLHVVTGDVDGGPIVAQAVSPVTPEWPVSRYQDVSYVQRVGLACVGVELWIRGELEIDAAAGSRTIDSLLPMDSSFSPAVRNKRARTYLANLAESPGLANG